jgi:redox-sensitive bicupin YhaK (pirin superfamily)/DNA-binding MarR family transcriptional regulator
MSQSAHKSTDPPNPADPLKLYIKLMRATNTVTEKMHKHLLAHRLSVSQFGVLEALYHLGPLCQKDLGAKILKTSGNITLVIDNLEKQGFVARKKDETDRRRMIIILTQAGRTLIQKIFPDHRAIAHTVFEALSPGEQETLGKLLKKTGNLPERIEEVSMIDIIKASDRQFNDLGWLQTYWLFSFSNYYDPANLSHGMLRVFNDDVVAPGKGFDTHPHEEMEIISIVLDGQMSHKDAMGNQTFIKENDLQRMTAGTGLYHSEINESDKPVHFYQIWIKPDKKRLEPSYAQKNFDPAAWKNRLALLASDREKPETVALNTRASIYRASLDPGKALDYTTDETKAVFIYLIQGSIEINRKPMEKNDQARISQERALEIRSGHGGEFLLIDVPA